MRPKAFFLTLTLVAELFFDTARLSLAGFLAEEIAICLTVKPFSSLAGYSDPLGGFE